MQDRTAGVFIDLASPFHLEYTVRALQRRPGNLVDVWDSGHYHRVFPTEDGNRLVTVEMVITAPTPRLKVAFEGGYVSTGEVDNVIATLRYMLSLDLDLGPFYRIARDDPQLRDPLAALCGLKPPRFPSLFEVLVGTVIFQQISLEAGMAIHSRLVRQLGEQLFLGDRTFYMFPTPYDTARASRDELRSLGLSTRKAEVILDLAEKAISGELALLDLGNLPSLQAIERLVKLRGLGQWSAELILLRGLGRLDVFPGGDTGARKNMARLLGRLGSLDQETERTILDRYGEYKGFLYFCALVGGGLRTGVFPIQPPAPGCL